jgi:hypothetical protein
VGSVERVHERSLAVAVGAECDAEELGPVQDLDAERAGRAGVPSAKWRPL